MASVAGSRMSEHQKGERIQERRPDSEASDYGDLRGIWASLIAQLVKNPPTVQEPRLRSLGWEDPLEKGTATHSSILACRIPWGDYCPRGRLWSQIVGQD